MAAGGAGTDHSRIPTTANEDEMSSIDGGQKEAAEERLSQSVTAVQAETSSSDESAYQLLTHPPLSNIDYNLNLG